MAKACEDGTRADRELFVYNLGWLLSQTRIGIDHIEYDDGEESDYESAIVHYDNGFARRVCIEWDSYAAIVNDVMKEVCYGQL